MAKDSKIEWTTHTFNPWFGCTKVSPACKNCYAEVMTKRTGLVVWGPQAERRISSNDNWKQPLKWAKAARAAGVRHRVFCASLADVFEDRPEVSDARLRLWNLIEATPELDWLLLTKRPENMDRMLPWRFQPYPNVWLGTTVEDQQRADERIPHLLRIRAAKRFLSVEPMIGPVGLETCYRDHSESSGLCDHEETGIDWVICGGESGHGARPLNIKWARSLRDQCKSAGVAFFMKQLSQADTKAYKDFESFPIDLQVREMPR